MLVRIQVTAYNGQPVPEPISAELDELGGSIGRGDGNSLVLPDPDRFISRTHAVVVFRAGHFIIQDKGSATPVRVNGRALGQGRESPIGDGDEVEIGGYTIKVTAQSAPAPAAKQSPQPLPSAMPAAKDDPLALFGGGASSSADPFADLHRPTPSGTRTSAHPQQALLDDPFGAPAGSARSGGAIPADFDPLGDFAQPSGNAPAGASLPDDLDLGFGRSATNQNIDELFGIGHGTGSDPFAPGSPLADTPIASGMVSASDPLAGFGPSPPTGPARAQRNDTPELHGSYQVPRAMPDPAMAPGAPSGAAPGDSSMMLSWDEEGTGTGEIKTIIIGTRRREVDPPAVQQAPATAAPAIAPPEENRPAAPPPAASAASRDDLLRAFLRGAGLPDFNLPGGVNPQTMAMLGELLRTATQGTLDLLLARAVVKREVRAEMTMIVARENNPLKFSPNVEAALAHLLTPQTRGFMSPTAAMQDAYDDLRTHQFGFMAGMRAALAGVLQRFNPEQLATRLTEKSMIDSLLPMNRKAKLWDLFEALYGDISKEAEDDFHALFGKEFLRAYEAQIAKLGERNPDAKP